MTSLKLILCSLTAFGCWHFYNRINLIPDKPELDPDPWWSMGNPSHRPDNFQIYPFTIDVPQEDVDDLRTRLSLPQRLIPALEGANFTYGFNSDTLKTIHNYWLKKYDWRSREKRLNQFSHFKTQIEGLDIHFIYAKPKPEELDSETKVFPLLLSHGWPGSFVEFYEILPMLTKVRTENNLKFAFEVVVPSLPGFGFSQASSKQGLSALQTAQIFLKLMKRLKFDKFYVQGGDYGSLVSTFMATLYPQNVLGVHLNMAEVRSVSSIIKMILGSYLPSGVFADPEEEYLVYPFSEYLSMALRETGYLHIQASKPDTLGAVLSNSPLGLVAYILEKFSTGTDTKNPWKKDGDLLSENFPISMDKLLDNVCIYWFTNSITSSVRYYKEFWSMAISSTIGKVPCDVPAAIAIFPKELLNKPRRFLEDKFTNIVSYTRMDAGGHFAALEQPKMLADDVFRFVSIVEKK